MTTAGQIAAERFARHGLAGRPCGSPAAAALLTTALQAQENMAGRLGIRARAPQVTDAEVISAIEVERSIVRTSLMRATIHLVASSDLRWLVRLVGPSIMRKFRTRWMQLGLTGELLDRTVALLPELLADGPQTRAQLRDALAANGVVLDGPDLPAQISHVTLHASAIGLLCRGPDLGRDTTFVPIDDWLPDAPAGPDGDEALAELARRYFRAYSPATTADFATWSGLAAKRAVDLIRDELTPVDLDGRAAYRLGEAPAARGVRLAPAFDNYLIGYRDRSAHLAPERVPDVYQGGWILPTVMRDGWVIGKWALDRARGRVTLEPFEPWPRAVQRAVEGEVDDLGRFLGRHITIAG